MIPDDVFKDMEREMLEPYLPEYKEGNGKGLACKMVTEDGCGYGTGEGDSAGWEFVLGFRNRFRKEVSPNGRGFSNGFNDNEMMLGYY